MKQSNVLLRCRGLFNIGVNYYNSANPGTTEQNAHNLWLIHSRMYITEISEPPQQHHQQPQPVIFQKSSTMSEQNISQYKQYLLPPPSPSRGAGPYPPPPTIFVQATGNLNHSVSLPDNATIWPLQIPPLYISALEDKFSRRLTSMYGFHMSYSSVLHTKLKQLQGKWEV